jgi:adenine-specific DNA-methyltransferase
MAKGPAYDFSDAEKRDLIALIQAGKPLPEKYRFLLFEDKREVELVWNGKTRDVCTTVLPFQSLEHVDEPRQEAGEKREAQFDLFDGRGRQIKGWTNKLIWGDNRLILSSLKSGPLREQIEEAGGLKLIYIDPPFDVGADFSMDIEIGGETFHKEPNLLEQIAYRDTWGRGADSFISMIYERLILMRDLLHPEGSIYVHCDWRVNAQLRLVLTEVFGKDNFRNEIIRIKCNPKNYTSTAFGNFHDTIYFFTRTDAAKLNPILEERNEEQLARDFPQVEEGSDRRYTTGALHAKGVRKGPTGEPWRGLKPPSGRHWAYVPETLDEFDSRGLIEWSSTGNPRLKRYADETEGKAIQSIWEMKDPGDRASEYATQKPEELLERIILASSRDGEIVADFFCGSGTTAAVAEELGRKWICADLGKFAIHTTRKRLIGVQRELKAAGKDFRAFEVLNLGRYERQAYLHVGGRLTREQRESALAAKEREFRELILRAYKAEPLNEASFFHGKTAGRLVVVGPINLPVGRLFVEEVITECRKRGATRVDLLAFEFEMGLFPAVLDEAKRKGIDLQPKYIPPEVFDKRAVDKGQVVFFDIAFVEATPRYDKKRPLSVSLELTDFSVFYSQGQADDLIKSLKDGKNGVVLDQGQLVKVSKDKNGVVTREVLTKKWTDWVDYWAVDFNYESRKEIIRKPKGVRPRAGDRDRRAGRAEIVEYEEVWTGGYLFENEWQSFRTRKSRDLELVSAPHTYDRPGRYTAAVKVIDIFGNDTMTLVPVTVG